MLSRILILMGFLIMIPSQVLATITINQLDILPANGIYEPYSLYPADSVSINSVQNEVYHLQGILPMLKNADWRVNVINQRARLDSLGDIRGIAVRPDMAYIFSSRNPSEATAHELGHLTRWAHITDEELNDYVKLRDDGKQHTTFHDTPEELFAEDFVAAFGSDMARGSIYKSTYNLPTIKEKAWIGERLGYTLPWPEKLDYFKLYPDKGMEEIDRCGQVWNQKIAGDKTGAEAAHVWADQIRELIKYPDTKLKP